MNQPDPLAHSKLPTPSPLFHLRSFIEEQLLYFPIPRNISPAVMARHLCNALIKELTFASYQKAWVAANSTDDDRRYIEAAQRLTISKEGELEVDDDAIVSKGCDEGAYVQAWLWVPDKEAGIDAGEDPDADE
jgi:hypothetical protein